MDVGFVASVNIVGVHGNSQFCGRQLRGAQAIRSQSRAVIRMQDEVTDLMAAQNCLEEGCEINEVQEILGRLEMKKQSLEEEVNRITLVMADLAKANLSKDRSFVAETMEAAVNLFQRSEDLYPKVGSPTPWSMDKPKKKRW